MKSIYAAVALLTLGCSGNEITLTPDKTDPGTIPPTDTIEETTPETGTGTVPGTTTTGTATTGTPGTGTPGTGTPGTGTPGTGTPGTDTGTPGTPTFGRPPGIDPPEFGTEDCENGYLVEFDGPEMVVLSWEPAVWGSIDAPEAGTYDVYDLVVAESGATQTNESLFLRIPNLANPDGFPDSANCLDDYVAVDPDNLGPLPAGTTQYLGTFSLDEGLNDIEANHYCETYRAGSCSFLHDPVTPCDSSNVNSVHITGGAVCLVPVL